MDTFLNQLFELLKSPAGSLTYHLVLAFAVAGAFQSSVNHWRQTGFPQGKRMVVGLSLLLLLQLLQFAASAISWQGALAPEVLLPPLERAVNLMGLVIILWLWSFPEPSRLVDVATILLGLLVLPFFALSLIWWMYQTPIAFYNGSWLDWAANGLASAYLFCGMLILLIRRPNGWWVGLGMLALILVGHGIRFFAVEDGSNFSGLVRLAQMAAYPLLLALPQRFPVPSESVRVEVPVMQPVRRTANPQYVLSLMLAVTENSPQTVCEQIVHSITEIMVADMCLLVTPPDGYGQMTVSCGYNLIQEKNVEGFSMSGRQLPLISTAMSKGRPLRLPASSTSSDLMVLANLLNLPRVGHLLTVPVVIPGLGSLFGIVLLSPFSNRAWTSEDQKILDQIGIILARILHDKQELKQASGADSQQVEMSQDSVAIIEQLKANNQELEEQLTKLYEQLRVEKARTESFSVQKPSEADVVVSQTAQAEYDQLGQELQLALEDVATLKEALFKADQELVKAKATGDSPQESGGQSEVVASMAQELRQPMSSILGYTDLLLSESAGILGALQRKFLERIKASVERMGGLTDDLIQLTAIDNGKLQLSPELVDLNEVVDEAVAGCMARLREKNIVLRMDLPIDLPSIHADRDALQQVLIHLLQNAGDATEAEGEIALVARVETQDNIEPYILIQVSDTGGGIPAEDLPRVFSRLYRADNPLIQGVGDTGVGLSIVKTLVEAHGGRIWVDSILGSGATFSILLPISSDVLFPTG
jgi:signal transduction histidine kinase